MPAAPHALPFVDIDFNAIERALDRARDLLSAEDFQLLKGLVDTLLQVTQLVRHRGSTIARLRRLFGLAGSEKLSDLLGPPPATGLASAPSGESVSGQGAVATEGPATYQDNAAEAGSDVGARGGVTAPNPDAPGVDPAPPAGEKKRRKGHGRVPAAEYLAAKHVLVAHESLHSGDPCPGCARGTIYGHKTSPIVRIVGRPPLIATCWDLEGMRCNTCGHVYTARAPQEAQGEKYDETAVAMIALLHYDGGTPFHRLDHLQRHLDTPVPASTQWDLVNDHVALVEPVYHELVRQAAQGQVLHSDDSYVRILDFMGKRRAKLLAKGELPDPERTGLFTTAIVAIVDAIGSICIFFTSRKHAGENLAAVLERRAKELPPPIQMGDALTRNVPKGHKTIEANCIAHGRRKIGDEVDNYPVECRFIIERLALVYKVDDACKARGDSDEERLLAHQRDSAPLMEELRAYMTGQLDRKRIEPNDDLGKAFHYFLKRWEKFTVFLRKAGAPLDNNIAERALKMAIRARNNSLFYRSQRGAYVGDVYMTLLHTAKLHRQNPFDYLNELLRNANAVADNPAQWMPWNYRQTLANLKDQAAARAARLDVSSSLAA